MSIDNSHIRVSDISVELFRKDVKNYHLSVNPPDGKVRMTIPRKVTDDNARLVIIRKLGWIKKQQDIFRNQVRQSAREFVSGETHFLWGKPYLLEVVYRYGKHEIIVKNNTHLQMFVRPGTSLANRNLVMSNWYRRHLKDQIPLMLQKWEPVVEVRADDWGVKKMKTKWGSCNIAAKRIWLNLELAKKPINCLEYILVHELVHLLERHHNDRFRSFLERFMPHWKLHKSVLNSAPLAHEEWKY